MTYTDPEEEEEFDLTEVLKNRMLGLGFDYLLIVEWLFDDDERTGLALHEWLLRKIPAGKVEYALCRSPAELEARLDQARLEVPTRGVPIVHIEAHGEDPSAGQTPSGFVGPDGNGGRELLTWEQLGSILRPLNIASRFNLLVVGAGCYGEGLLLGAQGGEPMPCVAVVGYTDTVSPMSLKHSLMELYYGLLLDKAELGLAVEAADRQHHFPHDAVLRSTSMVVLLAESFIQGTAITVRKMRAQFPLESTDVDGSSPKSGLASLPPVAVQFLRHGLESGWSLMWMLQEFPENAPRFAIDADRLIELAIEYADNR